MAGEEMINLIRLGDYNNNMLRDAHILKRSTAYAVDDKVNKGLIYLKCTQAGTTASTALSLSGVSVGDELTDGTAKWKVLSIKGVPEGGGGTGAGLEDWESNHNYAVDDIYVYEGEIYKTLIAFTSGSTEDSRTKINDVTPTAWTANTAYTAGDIIEHTDVTTLKKVYYDVTDDFTSGATFEVTAEMDELQIVEEYVPNPLTKQQVQNLINNFVPTGIGTPEAIVFASSPACYQRNKLFDTTKTTITIYPTWVNIGNKGSILGTAQTVDIENSDSWDDNTYVNYTDRAGKDFYIYMCYTDIGEEPNIILSASKTAPTGYDSTNSRLIGGFHCLCADVGTISGHTLSGYTAGNILPLSVWDLNFRANSDNDGMVYIKPINKWVDIYLSSWDSTNNILVSKYNQAFVTGETTPKMHGLLFAENYANVNKFLPSYDEFIIWAKGSTENVAIQGAANPITTGGHNNTAGSRIISNYGIEDSMGVLWQWTRTLAEDYKGSTWNTNNYWLDGYAWQENPVYNPNADSVQRGSCSGLLRRLRVGGSWSHSSDCGSRCVDANYFGSCLHASVSSRGCSDAIIKQ